ncbi:aminotransferase class I/II-fold pyridoxal phosphate-dependent enzyme [Porticoccus sp. W117]|uniref:aminotransferase class I/II-fold pyridoxal phosphate-dependent enzyme n=1 Tax=Porticoccus sp. W117 TaxID=3054777 RepID=UPI002591BC19|nr:aminotransferase class I/II-fold pyridoxal phosphate-dependent enzyme [Porticoccus sp. W117]MDM3871287.1 aminotransferase class I/II-fold pyridoxal phosphate-dependent enzyme [Porticoccus sp. W117]
MKFANRCRDITSFKAMDILAAAMELQAQGRDIVRMEVGEPAFATPQPVLEAAQQAMAAGHTKYTAACGIPQLREAVAELYRRRYGVTVAPGRVVITTGSSAALGMVCELLLNPGDGLLLSDPGYPCNPNFVRRLDAEPQRVPVDASNNFQLTADLARSHWQTNTRGVMVASPNNPTGEIITRENLVALHQLTAEKQAALVVDEIYHGLTYSDTESDATDVASILEVTDDAYVINSFSKYFGMTGWRLGWAIVPEVAQEKINTLAQNFYISSPAISQYAALAALQPETEEILEQRRQEFQRRRDFLVNGLREIGFGINHLPAGAFYVYANVEKLTDNGEGFCWRMLREQGVAFTPGTDFGVHNANKYVRFTYTAEMDRLEEALERLAVGVLSS